MSHTTSHPSPPGLTIQMHTSHTAPTSSTSLPHNNTGVQPEMAWRTLAGTSSLLPQIPAPVNVQNAPPCNRHQWRILGRHPDSCVLSPPGWRQPGVVNAAAPPSNPGMPHPPSQVVPPSSLYPYPFMAQFPPTNPAHPPYHVTSRAVHPFTSNPFVPAPPPFGVTSSCCSTHGGFYSIPQPMHTDGSRATSSQQQCSHPHPPPGPFVPRHPNEGPRQSIAIQNQPPSVPSSSRQTQGTTRPRSPSVTILSTNKAEADLARALTTQKIRRAELRVAQLRYQRSTAEVELRRRNLAEDNGQRDSGSPTNVADETDTKDSDRDSSSPRPRKRVKLEDGDVVEIMDDDGDNDSMSSPEM